MKANESWHPEVSSGGSLGGTDASGRQEEYTSAEAGRSQAFWRQDAVKKKESDTETNLVIS